MSNPIFPQPDPATAPLKIMEQEVAMLHGHSPAFGGEIWWNDIQQIQYMNASIRQVNLKRASAILSNAEYEEYILNEDAYYFPGKLPYIRPLDPNGYPQQGYNIHTHKNDFDGGYIAGAGDHDHRGGGHAGFAFAVYHPGTSIPFRSMKIET